MTASAQAVILVGGKGTRLFPYTALLPKPLVPVGEKAVLEWLLLNLRRHGITSVILAVHHMRQLIQAYFGDGSALGIRIAYAVEGEPLGTAGVLGNVLGTLGPQVLVANGDLLTDIDVGRFLAHHESTASDATIAAMRRTHRLEYGVLHTDPAGRLLRWDEKPAADHLLSIGLNALRRDALAACIRAGERIDMPELLMRMAAAGRRVTVAPHEGIWLDIGNPDEYARAQELAESGRRIPFDA
jgi:NDP-sugar pyrophosphorylase family protein